MLQKLTALSLSLLICLSLLPCQAGAMDASEDETPVQAADVEDQISPEDSDAGIAPCMYVPEKIPSVGASGVGAGDFYGGGGAVGGPMTGTGGICR